MLSTKTIWKRIIVCAALAVVLFLLGRLGYVLFAGAGGFPDLFALICTVLAGLFAIIAIVGASNRLVTARRGARTE